MRARGESAYISTYGKIDVEKRSAEGRSRSQRDESACVRKYGRDDEKKSAGRGRSKSKARGIEC